MSKRPWMPLYVGDYLADTRKLSTIQHGAYMLLIMEYWQHGGLPDDDTQLSRIVGMTSGEWKKARPVIKPLFQDGWKHARINKEIASAEAAYKRRAKAGAAGGKAGSKSKQSLSNASTMLKQSQSQSYSELKEEPFQGEETYSEVDRETGEVTGPFKVIGGGRP